VWLLCALQELLAVGSAVAAVTSLPLQAADQLKAAAEQVTEATQLLKHQVGVRTLSLECGNNSPVNALSTHCT
jgi:hypothetical protein